MRRIENELENQCRIEARKRGFVGAKLEKNSHKGIPDDLFISPSGVAFLVEFKRDKSANVRECQQVYLNKFPNLIHLIHSFSDFCQLLDKYVKSEL